jgi:ribosomal protein L37AE/L43A
LSVVFVDKRVKSTIIIRNQGEPMDQPVNCPRCQLPLTPDEEVTEILRCDQCGGNLVPASHVDENVSEEITKNLNSAEPGSENADILQSQPATFNCPACQSEMTSLGLDGAGLFRCSACGSAWADAFENSPDGETNNEKSSARRASRYLLYALTLPERTLRSTVAATAGAVQEAAGFLVPSAFQNSKTYEVVVKNSLKLLAEDVGGVETAAGEQKLGKDFVARKAVGNFVDLAGWATLAVSPVWMMAVVSDIAYGSKSYVKELADELKQKGLIDENSTINNVDDVLAAVQKATSNVATMVDTPPLSAEQLKETIDETRKAVASANYTGVLPEAELNRYWGEVREIAKKENVGLIGVSGALTMHAMGRIGGLTRGAITGVQVAGGLFNRHVIGHYTTALSSMRQHGFYKTVHESSEPYIAAVWRNFAGNKSTWTEEVVTGRAIGRAFRAVTGFFSRKKNTEESTDSQSVVEEEKCSSDSPPTDDEAAS